MESFRIGTVAFVTGATKLNLGWFVARGSEVTFSAGQSGQ